MSTDVDPFEKYARTLSPEQLSKVQATMDQLGVKRTDALFHVMAALDYYRVLYEDVPAKIKAAGDDALSAVHAAARLHGENEFESAKMSLAEAITAEARKLSAARDKTTLWIYSFFAIILVLTATIGAFFIGRFSNDNAYRTATAEAVSWFNSADGQYAKFVSDHGVLRALQICRASDRTLLISGTHVRCGVVRDRMHDAQNYPDLPTKSWDVGQRD